MYIHMLQLNAIKIKPIFFYACVCMWLTHMYVEIKLPAITQLKSSTKVTYFK